MDTLQFRAFVSYSRSDRQWAKILQARLEHYVLPQALRLIKPGMRHDRCPLKPIFRDEDELVPGQDLPERIRQGLKRSEYLIVVCSPSSAASQWVSKEIRDFIALGRKDSILAVVVDGQPNAESHGHAPELECLPTELRFHPELQKDETGKTIVTISSEPAEPLWVDWRKANHRNRPMFLRLVAALLSLSSLDELIRKDRAYQRRRTALLWSIVGVAACCILGLIFGLMVQAHRTAVKESDTLTELAQRAAQDENWERAARYGLLAMKRANSPLIGFRSGITEDVLVGALLGGQRSGPPYSVGKSSDKQTALASNGTVLAVAADDGTVHLLDPATGKLLRAPIHVGNSDGMAISPDGSTLAIPRDHDFKGKSDDSDLIDLQIWDLAQGKLTKTLVVVGQMVFRAEFSPDNKYVAVVGGYGDGGASAYLFDLSSGKNKALTGSAGGIDDVAFSPDSTKVACGWNEGVSVWSTATAGRMMDLPMLIGKMEAYMSDSQKSLAFSSDSKMIAVGTSNGDLVFWDLQKRVVTSENHLSRPITSVAFSRYGERFGVRYDNGVVHVWEGDDPVFYTDGDYTINHRLVPGGDFTFLPGDKQIVTMDSGTIRLWNLDTFESHNLSTGGSGSLWKGFSPDGHTLALLETKMQLTVLDTQSLAPISPPVTLRVDNMGSYRDILQLSPDGDLAANQNQHGTSIVNWRTGEQWQLEVKENRGGAVAFSSNGKMLAAAYFVAAVLPGDFDKRTGKVAPPDTIAAYSDLQLWDPVSRRPIGGVIEVPAEVTGVVFSPSGNQLALVCNDAPVQVWDVKRMVRIAASIEGHGIGAFSSDSKRLLTNSSQDGDDGLQFWDLATGRPSGPAIESKVSPRSVLLSPDGQRALLIGDSAEFWDLQANVPIGIPFKMNQTSTDAAHFTADWQRLMEIGSDVGTGGILETFESWSLGDKLHLRGHALIDEVCRTLLPGDLSRLSKEELAASPVLDPRRDTDACRR